MYYPSGLNEFGPNDLAQFSWVTMNGVPEIPTSRSDRVEHCKSIAIRLAETANNLFNIVSNGRMELLMMLNGGIKSLLLNSLLALIEIVNPPAYMEYLNNLLNDPTLLSVFFQAWQAKMVSLLLTEWTGLSYAIDDLIDRVGEISTFPVSDEVRNELRILAWQVGINMGLMKVPIKMTNSGLKASLNELIGYGLDANNPLLSLLSGDYRDGIMAVGAAQEWNLMS